MKLYLVNVDADLYMMGANDADVEKAAIDMFDVDGVPITACAVECKPGDAVLQDWETGIPFNTTNETRTVSELLAAMTDAEKGEQAK